VSRYHLPTLQGLGGGGLKELGSWIT